MKIAIKVIGALIATIASIFIGKGAIQIGDEIAEKKALQADDNSDVVAAAGGGTDGNGNGEPTTTEEVNTLQAEGSDSKS